MPTKGRTEERTRRIALVRSGIASGLSPEEIATEQDWPIAEVRKMRDDILRAEIQSVDGRDPRLLFAEYKIQMEGAIAGLRDVAETARSTPGQASALMGSLKAISDIRENIVRRGEQFGVIPREIQGADESVRRYEEMAPAELRREIAKDRAQLDRLLSYADVDLLDTAAEDVEAPPPEEEMPEEVTPAPAKPPAVRADDGTEIVRRKAPAA
jgi:hypothetical protein